jgi:hypothetical protein
MPSTALQLARQQLDAQVRSLENELVEADAEMTRGPSSRSASSGGAQVEGLRLAISAASNTPRKIAALAATLGDVRWKVNSGCPGAAAAADRGDRSSNRPESFANEIGQCFECLALTGPRSIQAVTRVQCKTLCRLIRAAAALIEGCSCSRSLGALIVGAQQCTLAVQATTLDLTASAIGSMLASVAMVQHELSALHGKLRSEIAAVKCRCSSTWREPCACKDSKRTNANAAVRNMVSNSGSAVARWHTSLKDAAGVAFLRQFGRAVLPEIRQQDWSAFREYFKGSRCSYSVHMWGLMLRSLLRDLRAGEMDNHEQSLKEDLQQCKKSNETTGSAIRTQRRRHQAVVSEVVCVALDRSINLLGTQLLAISPSRARSGQYRIDLLYTVLTAQLILREAACHFDVYASGLGAAIDAWCSLLLSAVAIVCAPVSSSLYSDCSALIYLCLDQAPCVLNFIKSESAISEPTHRARPLTVQIFLDAAGFDIPRCPRNMFDPNESKQCLGFGHSEVLGLQLPVRGTTYSKINRQPTLRAVRCRSGMNCFWRPQPAVWVLMLASSDAWFGEGQKCGRMRILH